jgi:hypothetical protein
MRLVSRCYDIGIPISDLKLMSYTMLNEIIQDRIEQMGNSKKKGNKIHQGPKARQSDIDNFLG